MIQSEIQWLQKAANDLKEVAQVAEDVSILIQKLAEDIKGKQHILDTYTARLLKADVRQGDDGDFYVSGLSNDDITDDVKMQDLQRRLRDVRKTCHQFDELDKLQSESARLIKKADKSADPLTTTPRRVFDTTAVTDQDTVRPRITDLLTTQDGLLIVVDYDNKMIKYVPRLLSTGHTLPALRLKNEPLCMSFLSDGLLAVTAEHKTIYLVEVKSQLTVKSQFKTRRQCYGVTDCPDDVTLLVSCWINRDDPRHASVDVIKRDGSLVRTITDGSTLNGFTNVFKVFAPDDHVLIPDNDQHCVYRVELSSGRLVDTLKHLT
ncbi:hypothetical protein V1264_022415 [Littorina saxatilis]|uniref:Uncharacterized protein n=1 Tax=Littorina saxatilis TaxID=31220 RepID=A0AAN9FXW1_9CAEN